MNIGRQCGSAEMKQCQRVIPPDIGVLWVGRVRAFGRRKKEEFLNLDY